MSRTETYIQQGQVITVNDKTQDRYGLFSLNKFLKNMFVRYHIGFWDDCCTTYGTATPDNELTNLPVFYNSSTGHFYYYNPTTQLPVQITAF